MGLTAKEKEEILIALYKHLESFKVSENPQKIIEISKLIDKVKSAERSKK